MNTPTEAHVAESIRLWLAQDPVLSRTEVAAEMGVTRQTMSNWCHGRSVPDTIQLGKLEAMKPGLVGRIFGG